MKAKDYVELYYKTEQQQGEKEAVWKIFQMVLEEFKTISEARNVRSDDACLAIVRELDQKWRAIRRRIPDLNSEGYSEFIKRNMPRVWELWQAQLIEISLRRGRRR